MLAPFVAMQVTDEVQWSAGDFACLAALLASALFAYEALAHRSSSAAYDRGVAVALTGTLLLAWIVGAVGIIGSERNAANLLFAAVPASGAVWALASRFRPAGMARAMVVMAATQVAIAAWVLLGGVTTRFPAQPVVLTIIFTAVWLVAAALFRRAAGGGDRAAALT